jgi:hypothetical protein
MWMVSCGNSPPSVRQGAARGCVAWQAALFSARPSSDLGHSILDGWSLRAPLTPRWLARPHRPSRPAALSELRGVRRPARRRARRGLRGHGASAGRVRPKVGVGSRPRREAPATANRQGRGAHERGAPGPLTCRLKGPVMPPSSDRRRSRPGLGGGSFFRLPAATDRPTCRTRVRCPSFRLVELVTSSLRTAPTGMGR